MFRVLRVPSLGAAEVSVTVFAEVLLNSAFVRVPDTMFYGFVILSAVGASHRAGKVSSVIKFWICILRMETGECWRCIGEIGKEKL